jgi:predicted dehydrogenase
MIGVGVIGYGYWGPNLARCFAETPDCRLVAISDLSPAAQARAALRHPGAQILTDWRELLSNPDVDAVAIATPVRSHYDLGLAVLRAGKHVLIEKPITETAAQASQLIDEAAARGLVLLVDHTFCFTPAIRKLRELIERGTLGNIYYYISNRMNLGIFQNDVDVIWDLAVHDIAILHHCLGSGPVAVSASGASHVSGRPANMAHVTLFFEGGLIADLNVNWLSPVKIRQTILGGSERMVVYDDLEQSEKLKIYDSGVQLSNDPKEIHRLMVAYRIGDMVAPRLDTGEALLAETAHFADCVQTGRPPITDGEMGLHVVKILEAASQSMRQRGQPIEFRQLRMAS